MTIQRFDVDPLDATAKAAASYPGGIDMLAHRLLISPKVFRNKLSHTVETHRLALDEFSEVLDKLNEVGSSLASLPLQALCWRHDHVAVPLPASAGDSDELLAMVVEIFGAGGKLADQIGQALADDRKISDREAKTIEVRIAQVMESLVVLRDRVRTKNLEDFHGAGR